MASKPNDKLSTCTKVISYSFIPATLSLVAAFSPKTALLSIPILAIPVIFLRRCYLQTPTQLKHVETLTWTMLGTGTVGLAIVAAVQGALFQPFSNLLFGSQAPTYFSEFIRENVNTLTESEIQTRASTAWTPEYFTFIFAFAFGMAALPEEVLKYLAVSLAKHKGAIRTETQYLQAAIAATLGFATIENIGFLYAARNENTGLLLLTLLERIFLGMPAHALSGCLIALGMIRRDVREEKISYARLLLRPVLFHGAWDFGLLAISAFNGNVGWVHPKEPLGVGMALAVAAGISFAAWRQVRGEMKRLGVGL